MTTALIESYVKQLAAARCRGLVVLSGDAAWAIAQAQALMSRLPQALWLGEGAPAGIDTASIGAGKNYLGRELPHAVVNGFSGIHPNSLGALTGAITAGGVLVLLVPPLAQWPQRPDPDYQRLRVENYRSRQQLFIQRLATVLQQQQGIVVWQQGQQPTLPTLAPTIAHGGEPPYKTADQCTAVAAIIKVASGHRRRPLLITAKRGRGKSASLGLAANRLVEQYGKRIIVCAPSQAAVAELFKFVAPAQQHGVVFYTVEAMQRLQPQADLVLVDEAAGIPVPLLSQWLQRYSRIVYASTTYGYEGYGQGFSLRFVAAMAASTAQYKHVALHQPIRWQAPDPLEQCVDQALLLGAPLASLTAQYAGAVAYQQVSQRDLAADEQLLAQVYALLVGAHYQTTPDDLRILLDGPNISLLIACQQHTVVGVLMLAQEGAVAPALHAHIAAATRRIKGHLAPQLITVNTGATELLSQRLWRVVRIAVHPQRRRCGVAAGLLAYAQEAARAQQLDAICAVFGFTAELLPFWQHCGFAPLCVSTRQDSASGAYSGAVYKGLHAAAEAVQQRLLAQLPLQLQHGGSDYLGQLCPSTLLAILRCCTVPQLFSKGELAQLEHFAHANKPLETCLPVLTKAALAMPALLPLLPEATLWPLVVRLVLKWPMPRIVAQSTITGKAQLVAAMRFAVAQGLPHFQAEPTLHA